MIIIYDMKIIDDDSHARENSFFHEMLQTIRLFFRIKSKFCHTRR